MAVPTAGPWLTEAPRPRETVDPLEASLLQSWPFRADTVLGDGVNPFGSHRPNSEVKENGEKRRRGPGFESGIPS